MVTTYSNNFSKTQKLVYCALFAALISVGAFIKIPLPTIPITLQFLFTNLAGLLLGPILGAAAVCLYIFIGLLGVPVFTVGGGFGAILQPTFGYIIGFVFGAWSAGYIAHKVEDPSARRLFLAGISNLIVLYFFGTIWHYFLATYYLSNPKGILTLFIFSVLIFIPGDLLSCMVSVPIAKRLLPVLRKKR